jgi:hypothetical protein
VKHRRRRRCPCCSRLFLPDPRVGNRQRTCGEVACKARWHRRGCQRWREQNLGATEAYRLRLRLGSPELNRAVVREAMGPKATVVIEEVFRLAARGSREAFVAKQLDLSRESFRLVARPPREATEGGRTAP